MPTAEHVEFLREHPIVPGRGAVIGRVGDRAAHVHVADVWPIPSIRWTSRRRVGGASARCSACRCCATRSLIGVIVSDRTRGAARSPTSRSSWSRPSPTRPSSRSRTRGCSTRCRRARASSPNRWSSRPRPPRCCRSSRARPASWSRCSRPCWRTRRASATPSSAPCSFDEGDAFRSSRMLGAPPAFAEDRQRGPSPPRTAEPRSAASSDTKQAVQIADVAAEPAYVDGDRHVAGVELGGYRTVARRSDAQGGRADRRHQHLPPGGAAVHRQADRAGHELRQPGRHRHREHAPAQRAAQRTDDLRIAAAADRHRRRAQGHQPLDRSICRPCSTRWSKSAARLCEADMASIIPLDGRHLSQVASYGLLAANSRQFMASRADSGRARVRWWGASLLEGQTVHIRRRAGRPGIHHSGRRRSSAAFGTVLGVPLLREGDADRRDRPAAQDVRPFTDKQIELVDDLRRPGGDRDRERAAVRRGAGAHARAHRVAGAADRDRRRAQGHLAARPSICSRCSTPCWRTRSALCEAEHGVICRLRRRHATTGRRKLRHAAGRTSSSLQRASIRAGSRHGARTRRTRAAGRPRCRRAGRPRVYLQRGCGDSAASAHPRRAAAAGR